MQTDMILFLETKYFDQFPNAWLGRRAKIQIFNAIKIIKFSWTAAKSKLEIMLQANKRLQFLKFPTFTKRSVTMK